MSFHTINPYTNDILETFEYDSLDGLNNKALKAHREFLKWKDLSVEERRPYFKNLARVLETNREEYAITITNEMGKSLNEALGEVDKCKTLVEFYVENAAEYLKDQELNADGKKHFIRFEPLGVILSIMPWNFPMWQALRFAVPSLFAGNTTLVKSAEETTHSGICLENAFLQAGFPEGVYQSILASHQQVASLMEEKVIRGASFTGSTRGGKEVYQVAASQLKKVVLELGGSDPLIVMDDANIDDVVEGAVLGRLFNAGQTCIAAKRFIVFEKIFDEFMNKFTAAMKSKTVGDPCFKDTDLGPLYSQKGLAILKEQLEDAKSKGAMVHCGGELKEKDSLLFLPTVISNISKEMKVYSEEVFGPMAAVYKVKNAEEAIALANGTDFGLGASIWGENSEKTGQMAEELDCGAVFINSTVKSDPRVPFGGVKSSGIGKELGEQGIKEFTNAKTINIYN